MIRTRRDLPKMSSLIGGVHPASERQAFVWSRSNGSVQSGSTFCFLRGFQSRCTLKRSLLICRLAIFESRV
jgi:hypothetical protein